MIQLTIDPVQLFTFFIGGCLGASLMLLFIGLTGDL